MVDGEEYVDRRTTVRAWKNFGDADPREHGGRFLKFEEEEYTSDHWTLVITTDMEGHSLVEGSDDRYLFQEWFIEPDMVWVDGDPEKGFTEEMQDEVNEVREDINPQDIEKVESILPFLVSHIRAVGYDTYAANYWEHLEGNWGISASQFA